MVANLKIYLITKNQGDSVWVPHLAAHKVESLSWVWGLQMPVQRTVYELGFHEV